MYGGRAGKWIGPVVISGLVISSSASAWQLRETVPASGQELEAGPYAGEAAETTVQNAFQPGSAPAVDAEGTSARASGPFAAFSCEAGDLDVAGLPVSDVFSASFNHVRPGSTTVAEAKQRWGHPVAEVMKDDAVVLRYRLPSFPQVALISRDGTVTSVVVHLEPALPVDQVAARMGVDQFTSVPIVAKDATVLGCVFPERGVMLGFTEGQPPEVAQVILEPIAAESFRLRAEQVRRHRYQQALADLDAATTLDPQDARAFWLRAEMQLLAGQAQQAAEDAQRAVQLDPTQSLYRLTHARTLVEQGQAQAAGEQLQQLADPAVHPPVVVALAHYHLGELKTHGSGADFHAAMEHHLKAIEGASTLIDASQAAVRRLAKYTLVRAHLAVAVDVAMGNFERQSEVVPQWLAQATELAEDYMTSDGGDPTLRMHIYCTTMEAMAAIDSPMDASVAAADARAEAQTLLGDSPDPLYQREVASLLAETLYHVARLQRGQYELQRCKDYAQQALVLLEAQHAGQDTTQVEYLRGQLEFLIGSICAVHDQNHGQAVEWFNRAVEHLGRREDVTASLNVVHYGEMLVSMGVSYWEEGDHAQAIALTELGIEALEEGVEQGGLDSNVLVIPHNNLAAMRGESGLPAEEDRLPEQIAELPAAEQLR
jgi:tetratricopeptide (TPR) repeat protein